MTATQVMPSGVFQLGGDLPVNRLGYGAMRITGPGIWGEPADRSGAIAVLRRAVELGVNFIDTADAYGPYVSEELIREALRRIRSGSSRRSGPRARSGTSVCPKWTSRRCRRWRASPTSSACRTTRAVHRQAHGPDSARWRRRSRSAGS